MKNIFNECLKKTDSKQNKILLDFIFPEFIERDECVFLKKDDNHKIYSLSNFHDKTDMEACMNHYHIDELFKGALKKYRRSLCEAWKIKLKRAFPEKKFIIYLSNEKIIRFHQIHENESLWYDLDDKEFIAKNKIEYFLV